MNVPREKPYQQLVAEVASAFDPGAKTTEGEWIAGPDGRLDMDVAMRGQIDGQDVLAVIECKDFNPKSTGRVGREFVDAQSFTAILDLPRMPCTKPSERESA